MRRIFPPPAAAVSPVAEYPYPDGPWLRCNMISSVDGAAWLDGRAGGLGNPADRRLLSLLRGLADVVIVGAETVRTENYGPVRPSAQWRPDGRDVRAGRAPAPPLAVVSRRLDLDFAAPLFSAARTPTIVITCESAPADRLRQAEKCAEVIVAGTDLVDVGAAVDLLVARGHTRLLSEGGPRLLGQLAAADRIDELCLTVSPMLVAGDAARIVNGAPLSVGQPLRLAHVLEEEGTLFTRYVRVLPG
jgi:riboflavin biosynthesis pyrimidine reductase